MKKLFFRKIFAIFLAKAVIFIGKALKRKTTSMPGKIALKIFPDLIKILSNDIKNEIILVTGTNGKTTVNNILCSILESQYCNVACNKLGANMLDGIASALIEKTSFLGKMKASYACFEVDEAYLEKIFNCTKPNALVITNFFRDQIDRYGEIDKIIEMIKNALKRVKNIKLVLNADDPLTAKFGFKENEFEFVYFGINEKTANSTENIREGRFCALCTNELTYEYYHYGQLGKYFCEKCGYKRPEAHFTAHEINFGKSFKINGHDVNFSKQGMYDVYNILAGLSALCACGIFGLEKANQLLEPSLPGRMEKFNLSCGNLILNLSKNPAGFNQAIEVLSKDEREKNIVVIINDNVQDGRDVSWLWDVEFEKIKSEKIKSITCSGSRFYDMLLRFKYSGINVNHSSPNISRALRESLISNNKVTYVLVNYTALFKTRDVILKLSKGFSKINFAKSSDDNNNNSE